MVERTQILVLDASVAVKWYVEEELREQALALRHDYYEEKLLLISQPLLLYEVANALRYHPTLSSEDVMTAIDSLLAMQFNLITLGKNEAEAAVKIAFDENLSMYDATYLALADITGTQIVTADESFYKKLSTERKKLVLLLGNYQ